LVVGKLFFADSDEKFSGSWIMNNIEIFRKSNVFLRELGAKNSDGGLRCRKHT